MLKNSKTLNDAVSYAGITVNGVSLPSHVAIRLQHVFVGIESGATRHVAPANFSYQTQSDDDPRNLLLVATSMGMYAQVDGVGWKKLLATEASADGKMTSKWFKVTASESGVGYSTSGKKAKRGVELGIRGSDVRENRMLLISIPLKQRTRFEDYDDDEDAFGIPSYRSLLAPVGEARAARLGVGKVVDEVDVKELEVEMDHTEAVVVTEIDYNTLELAPGHTAVRVGEEAVRSAIADMNRQYDMCESQCKLSQLPAMLHKMTAQDERVIRTTLEKAAQEKAAQASFAPRKDALRLFA